MSHLRGTPKGTSNFVKSFLVGYVTPRVLKPLSHIVKLAGKGVRGFEETIDVHLRQWIKKYESECAVNEGGYVQLDLAKSLPLLAVDLISHMVLGKSFDCVANDTDQYNFLAYTRTGVLVQQAMSVFLELKSALHGLSSIPLLRPWMTFFPHVGHEEGIGRVMRVCRTTPQTMRIDVLTSKDIQHAVRTRIKERKENEFKSDMLSCFLEKGLTADHALPELAVVIASGTDNFASATQAIILCIITNPNTYRRLQEEIEAATAGGDISFPISEIAARRLDYLQACICEGLRMMPPDTHLRERMVSPEGDTVHGYFLPGGTFVGLNSQATQLHPVYGPDREMFRPERWLSKDEETLQQMHKTLELLFSYGSSKCLGYALTHIQISKIVFEVRDPKPKHRWRWAPSRLNSFSDTLMCA
jgi:cytochrome P450